MHPCTIRPCKFARLTAARSAMKFLPTLLAPVLASRCDGAAEPGPRNELPIDTAPPVFVSQVANGKLYTVGLGEDKKDLVHLWGTAYEQGEAMGQLLRPKLREFVPQVYTYAETQAVAKVGDVAWCTAHRVKCAALKWIVKLGITAALDLSFDHTKE